MYEPFCSILFRATRGDKRADCTKRGTLQPAEHSDLCHTMTQRNSHAISYDHPDIYGACSDGMTQCTWFVAGYYAIDSLHLEAGYRAWGHELGVSETPFDTGLTFTAVD
jgi:hypothetical protein